MKQLLFLVSVVLVLAIILRIPFLSQLPPGNGQFFLARVITSLAGIGTVLLTMFIVQRQTKQLLLTFLTGLVLVLMPFHIEQSRVYSPAMQSLCVALVGIVVWLRTTKPLYRFFIVLATAIFCLLVFNSSYLLQQPNVIRTTYLFDNIAKLWSGDFLFYKNDSFWLGGLRNVGVMLPWMLPFFVVGLFQVLKIIRKENCIWLGIFILITIVAALNPQFPEQREYLFATPLFAVVIGLGIAQLIQASKQQMLFKMVFVCLALFAVYGQIWFIHSYLFHYAPRIRQEISKEMILF